MQEGPRSLWAMLLRAEQTLKCGIVKKQLKIQKSMWWGPDNRHFFFMILEFQRLSPPARPTNPGLASENPRLAPGCLPLPLHLPWQHKQMSSYSEASFSKADSRLLALWPRIYSHPTGSSSRYHHLGKQEDQMSPSRFGGAGNKPSKWLGTFN